MRIRPKVGIVLLTLGVGLYLLNASWLAKAKPQNREILAHRGLHQTFNPQGVKNNTCTAKRIDTPRHNYIENTIPAIQAAISMGASIIEFDIHPTTDGEFMVFHDWTLECRTNGVGKTRDHDSIYLKTLDTGYGYTADNGTTFPFRGKFQGAMPSLHDVLTQFPKTKFLINIKSRNKNEGQLLSHYLSSRNLNTHNRLSVYGNGAGVEYFKTLNPHVKILTKSGAKKCLKSYILTGWSGHMPKACHDTFVLVPENYQWAVWGWPARFETRLEKVNSRAILSGPYTKARANRAIDDLNAIANIPTDFGGIIWTNRIDLFTPP